MKRVCIRLEKTQKKKKKKKQEMLGSIIQADNEYGDDGEHDHET
jgi:hypothetical protein